MMKSLKQILWVNNHYKTNDFLRHSGLEFNQFDRYFRWETIDNSVWWPVSRLIREGIRHE